MFKYLSIIFLIITFYSIAYSSDEITIDFENSNRYSTNEQGMCPIHKYVYGNDGKFTLKDRITGRKKEYQIKLPRMDNIIDTAFSMYLFNGWYKSELVLPLVIVIGNYNKDISYLWIDFNNNFDLSDDGIPLVITKDNPVQHFYINNPYNPDQKYYYEIKKFDIKDSAIRASIAYNYYNRDPDLGLITTDMDYWLIPNNCNAFQKETTINGKQYSVALIDWNNNGIYNDMDTVSDDHSGSDRINIGKSGDNKLSGYLWDGATQYYPGALLKAGIKNYEVTDIDKNGKYIKINYSNKTFKKTQIGDKCPNFEVVMVDSNNTRAMFNDKLVKGEYNLLYIWSLGCPDCSDNILQLNAIDTLYKDKIHILGLYNSNFITSTIVDKLNSRDITWTNITLSSEIENYLLCGGFLCHFVLLDKNFKIVDFDFDFDLRKLEEIIK